MTNHAELFTRANRAVIDSLGPAPENVDIPHVKRTSATLAGRIDHTLLKPDAAMAAIQTPVSYTHLTLPTNREV